ncbi:Gfo/Idh/MocA family oxidoreductase [candidate division KSB1 bacterium]|nr:Gfo/Idh/MocA family oxidoreductase [candidate division KSB1 bacterium]
MHLTRRNFLQIAGSAAATIGFGSRNTMPGQKPIQGFEKAVTDKEDSKNWKPVSDRKIRVGIAGYGYCKFGAAFGFQDHPNVTVAAITDLIPDNCAELAKACRCEKTYPSCEEMIKDDSIEAIFIATDAPSHARLAIMALKAGKHVASAVPAVFGSLEDADELFQTVKTADRKYMMFETSYFHEDLYAMRQMYKAGDLGKVIYTEGEYWHYFPTSLPSYDPKRNEVNLTGWREGLPPQWYPTHSNAYYVGVTDGSFTEVSCMAMPSIISHLQPANNRYKNPFGTEIALFCTSEGGMARMGVSWDTPGASGELGRIRTQKGTFYEMFEDNESNKNYPLIKRPPLPPGVEAGGHGGSHGYLMDEFVHAILLDRNPLVDIAQALNMTVSGIIAHQSALKNGELLKIPQYKL